MKNLRNFLLIPILLGVLFATHAAAQTETDELAASRILIDALERENAALRSRVETERQRTALLTELAAVRKTETEALRTARAAKNETIAAKDAAIERQDALIAELRRRKTSVWKRIGDIAIGAVAGALLR